MKNVKIFAKEILRSLALVFVGYLMISLHLMVFGYTLIVAGHYKIAKIVMNLVGPSFFENFSLDNILANIVCNARHFVRMVCDKADQLDR